MTKKLVVRIDDVHPTMDGDRFRYFASRMREIDCQGLLGIIPNCLDKGLMRGDKIPEFWAWMSELKSDGWVISMHGYKHVYDTRGETLLRGVEKSEFAGHELSEQIARIRAAKSIMMSKGLDTDVFMAPKHSFDMNTIKALLANDFKYITDGFGLYAYDVMGITVVPQLFSRPHGFSIGVTTTCLHLDNMTYAEIDNFIDKIKHYEVISFYSATRINTNKFVRNLLRFLTYCFVVLYRKKKRNKNLL